MFNELFLTRDFDSPPPAGLPAYVWLLCIAVFSDFEGYIKMAQEELEMS